MKKKNIFAALCAGLLMISAPAQAGWLSCGTSFLNKSLKCATKCINRNRELIDPLVALTLTTAAFAVVFKVLSDNISERDKNPGLYYLGNYIDKENAQAIKYINEMNGIAQPIANMTKYSAGAIWINLWTNPLNAKSTKPISDDQIIEFEKARLNLIECTLKKDTSNSSDTE